eukprot:GHVL01023188.1.p1 GENE.GHVL01023188.1~~GHVL01023188.1.p1  ORF type:complete len:128 (+),score=21.49 GHVL01023188.1:23-406(+)
MNISGDQESSLRDQIKNIPPYSVDGLISDMKMFVAYESAADWKEEGAMKKAFDSLSWDDPHVKRCLPLYLKSTGTQRARVDYAYNVICPRTVDPRDPNRAMMSLWLKARLFSYDSQFPFQLNPYARD